MRVMILGTTSHRTCSFHRPTEKEIKHWSLTINHSLLCSHISLYGSAFLCTYKFNFWTIVMGTICRSIPVNYYVSLLFTISIYETKDTRATPCITSTIFISLAVFLVGNNSFINATAFSKVWWSVKPMFLFVKETLTLESCAMIPTDVGKALCFNPYVDLGKKLRFAYN